MQAAARKWPRLVWMLAYGLAVSPVAARPSIASAAQASAQGPLSAPQRDADAMAEDDMRARLEAIYSAANDAIQVGNHAAAAERYAEVLRVLGESRATHESRALALLDSVAARRIAQSQGLPHQLCRARDLTLEYLATTRLAHGGAARDFDGVRQAEQLERELLAEISRLSDPTCPGDQASAPEPAPVVHIEPAPQPGPDRRVIAGGVLLGIGGLALGLMATGLGLGASTGARLRDTRRADPGRDIDALLADALIQRGQASNRLAIAGSVLAGVALAAGATLLIVGRTRGRPPPTRPARIDLTPGGLGLRF